MTTPEYQFIRLDDYNTIVISGGYLYRFFNGKCYQITPIPTAAMTNKEQIEQIISRIFDYFRPLSKSAGYTLDEPALRDEAAAAIEGLFQTQSEALQQALSEVERLRAVTVAQGEELSRCHEGLRQQSQTVDHWKHEHEKQADELQQASTKALEWDMYKPLMERMHGDIKQYQADLAATQQQNAELQREVERWKASSNRKTEQLLSLKLLPAFVTWNKENDEPMIYRQSEVDWLLELQAKELLDHISRDDQPTPPAT